MRLEVDPPEPLVDDVIRLRVLDAPPRSRVEITATTVDERDVTWSSSAVVQVGPDGTVDVGSEPPVSGSFTDADPMGLIWRMRPTQRSASYFATPIDAGVTIAFTAVSQTPQPDSADLVVSFAYGRDISAVDVSEDDVVGTLYEPAGSDPAGAILVVPDFLPTSSTAHPTAALLATKGYLAMVLEYPTHNGPLATIWEQPLELFLDALKMLARHPRAEKGRIAIHASGKGAEAALSAVSRVPGIDLQAIVAVAPSCATWQAIELGLPRSGSSWTWGDIIVPYLAIRSGPVLGGKLIESVAKQLPDSRAPRLMMDHLAAFRDQSALTGTMISVSAIATPMLLICGEDDQYWPSAQMLELIHRRRQRKNVGVDDEILSFEKAGHLFRPPFLPTTVNRWIDPAGNGVAFGGEPQASLHANVEAWATTLEFLRDRLG